MCNLGRRSRCTEASTSPRSPSASTASATCSRGCTATSTSPPSPYRLATAPEDESRAAAQDRRPRADPRGRPRRRADEHGDDARRRRRRPLCVADGRARVQGAHRHARPAPVARGSTPCPTRRRSSRVHRAMEATPDWLDMELVEEGARQARIPAALPGALRHARRVRRDLHEHLRRAADGAHRRARRPQGARGASTRRRASSPSRRCPARWTASARASRRRRWSG